MFCPECKTGSLRVFKMVAYGGGHHPLVCDACRSWFKVKPGSTVPAFDMRAPSADEIVKDERISARIGQLIAARSPEEFKTFFQGLPLLPDPTPAA